MLVFLLVKTAKATHFALFPAPGAVVCYVFRPFGVDVVKEAGARAERNSRRARW